MDRQAQIRVRLYGDVAKWQGRGLQNPDRRFESGRRLSIIPDIFLNDIANIDADHIG